MSSYIRGVTAICVTGDPETTWAVWGADREDMNHWYREAVKGGLYPRPLYRVVVVKAKLEAA